MKNKICALLLSACMCFVLCACGDGADSKEKAPAQVAPVGVNDTVKENAASADNTVVKEEKPAGKTGTSSEKTDKAPVAKGTDKADNGIVSE